MFRWGKGIAGLTLGLAFIFPGVIGLAGALQPDYSPVSDAVSALGAPDAVMPGLINIAGFGLAGVLILLFAALIPLMTAVYRGQKGGYGRFVWFSLVTGAALLGLFILLPAALWFGWAGLQERLFLIIYLAWLTVFGCSVWRQL